MVTADAFDVRAHFLKKMTQVDNFGFAGGAFDLGQPFGHDRSHNHVGCACDSAPVSSTKKNIATLELGSVDANIAFFSTDRTAKLS